MPCAFTQKIVKMSQMLMSLGHEVFIYGVEGSDAPCTEFIQVAELKSLAQTLGDAGSKLPLGYDWTKESFRVDFQNEKPYSHEFIKRSIEGILARKKDDDFLLLTMGYTQKPIADAANLFLTLEYGIGHRGSYATFRAFESNFLRSYQYGVENHRVSNVIDGKYYDRVIPNYFDPRDFKAFAPDLDNPYAMYVGRMIHRKGISIAIDASKAAGIRLVMAGQGASWIGKKLQCEGTSFEDIPHVEYLGVVGPEERNELMGRAVCNLSPTIYLEPFGGVNVEAQLSGTPAIASAFGAFPECIIDGKTGVLCNTFADFVNAIKLCRDVGLDSPEDIKRHADRYLMDNVKHEFEKWFRDLYEVYLSRTGKSAGWYALDESPLAKEKPGEWEVAQRWEQSWWERNTAEFTNTLGEEMKQLGYAEVMGLDIDKTDGRWIEGGNKSILDIGGGPTSLLLKVRGAKRRVVIDSMKLPDWVIQRYKGAGIDYCNMMAEDAEPDNWDKGFFDEVWFYNLLQHTDNPEKIVKNALSLAKRIRVFEWINTIKNIGHPHILTVTKLNEWFGAEGTVGEFNNLEIGLLGEYYVIDVRRGS